MCNLVEQELNCELCQHLLDLEWKTDVIIACLFVCFLFCLGRFMFKLWANHNVNNNEVDNDGK